MSNLLRKHATSVALVALALGVGAYVLIVDRGKPSSEELESRKDDLFPVFHRDELTQIDLEAGGVRATIVRRGDRDAGEDLFWFVSGGSEEKADQIAVEQLLQTLEFARRIRKVEPGFDRAEAGLDNPRLKLAAKMGPDTFSVALGADAKSPRGAAFAEIAGDGVYIVSPDFVRGVLAPIDTYRSHNVLPYTSSVLSAISLDGPEGHRKFVRGPWGGFRLDGNPPGPRVNQAVFDRMLSAFASISADRFLDDRTADAALAPPDSRISLTLEPKDAAQPAAVIELGGSCPAAGKEDAAPSKSSIVAIRRKPTRLNACVPASVLDDLRAPASAFADRKLLSAHEDELEEIVLAQGDRSLDLARQGSGWHLRKPEDRSLTAAEAAGLVTSLLGLEGEVVANPDKKALGLEPPAGSLTIRTHGQGEEAQDEQKVDIGTLSPADGLVALREQDGVALRLTGEQARSLQPSLVQLKSTELVDLAASAISKVSVSLDGQPLQTVERTEDGFRLAAPAGFEADGTLASDLFASIATLSASRWVADHDDGTFGLGAPRMEVRFDAKADGGVESRRLLLGTEVAGGSFARWDPDSGVFVIPRSAEAALRGLAIDRSALTLDASQVASVQLEAGGAKTVLVARGEQWSSMADAGVALADAAVGRVQRALLELRPERAVHVGAARESEGFDKPSLKVLIKRVAGHGADSKDIEILLGRADVWESMNVFYARRKGVDATFVVAASKVQPLLDALGR